MLARFDVSSVGLTDLIMTSPTHCVSMKRSPVAVWNQPTESDCSCFKVKLFNRVGKRIVINLSLVNAVYLIEYSRCCSNINGLDGRMGGGGGGLLLRPS